MKKFLLGFLKLTLSLGLGIALIYWFIGRMTPEEKQQTIDTFTRANYFWIALAPLMGMVSNFSRTQRWRILLETTGYKPGFWNTFLSVIVMYFFNLFFPRLGEITRCGALARYENVPMDKSIGTMVIERLTDVVSILVVGGLLLFIEHDRLYSFFVTKALHQAPAEAGSADYTKWVAVVLALVFLAGAALYVQRKYGFVRLRMLIKERLRGFAEGLKSIKNIKQPGAFLFHSVFIWLCYFLMIYWSFPALPETQGLGVSAGVACLFLGGFAMAATPGGIGVYPIFIQQILVLYGVNETIGYAFGSVVWAAQMSVILAGGIIALVLLALMNRRPDPSQSA